MWILLHKIYNVLCSSKRGGYLVDILRIDSKYIYVIEDKRGRWYMMDGKEVKIVFNCVTVDGELVVTKGVATI